MESYDILRTEMRTIQPVFKEDQVKMLKDKRIAMLLNFLQTPKTFMEIKNFFHDLKFNTCSGDIAGLLTGLIDAGLIIEAGRRISRDKNQRMIINKLFTRSACIFDIQTNRQPIVYSNMELLFLKQILCEKCTTQSSNLSKINEQMKEIANRRNLIFEDLVSRSNDILNPRKKNYDWTRIYTLLDISSWLVLFKKNKETLEKLFTLYD